MTSANHTERPGGVTFADAVVHEPHPWGRLEWMASGDIGNSAALTVGRCYIEPGQANPVHHHPNCDEVLHVVRGHIRHRVGDDHVEMGPGDTISIPVGAVHNATNIGDERCELLICFDTPSRQVVGE